MVRHTKLPSKCFSPLSDPGNHGSDASMSLQVAPFQAEGNSIWIGYHAQPSRKYLGVFPSYEEVIDRCRRNAFAGRMNKSFPRFKTDARAEGGVVHHPDCPGSYLRHVCCAGCQVHGTDCERLTLEFLAVETPDDKDSTVFLLQYKFYLRGELMVALVHHFNHGKYSFQKTDGTLSKVLLMDSKHRCLNPSQLRDSEASSDTSSLTQFDCVEDEDEDEDAIIARESPRVSLRSSQHHQLQEQAVVVVRAPSQITSLPQELPSQPRSRGSVVIDLSDDDEPTPIKQEQPEQFHTVDLVPYKTSTPTPASTPSIVQTEEISFTSHFGPDPLAEEYGRITTQIFQEYSMRVFALSEVKQLIQRMKQAVKAGDRAALCRAYGALQAFLITVE